MFECSFYGWSDTIFQIFSTTLKLKTNWDCNYIYYRQFNNLMLKYDTLWPNKALHKVWAVGTWLAHNLGMNWIVRGKKTLNHLQTLTFSFHSYRGKTWINHVWSGVHSSGRFIQILINCDVRSFRCSFLCKGPVSVLPQGCQSKVICGREPNLPPKGAQGELKQRPREKDIKVLGALCCCLVQFPKMTPRGRMDIKITTVDLMILS